ncbi:MAG: hypothetical protein ABFD97_18295 [Syntrophobacter sp.]
MATADLSVTGKQIVEAAMRELGALASGEPATPEELQDGLQALNLLVKSWMGPNNLLAPGLKIWQRTRTTLTLLEQNSFSVKLVTGDLLIDPPISILSATLRNTDGEDLLILTPMSLAEYQAIPNKSVTGTPSRFYYERGITEGTIYLDCIPSDTTMTIPLVYLRILNDFDELDGSDPPDFPQEWFRPLKFNLAVDLYPEYPTCTGDRFKIIAALAQSTLAQANMFAPDNGDPVVYFEPGRDD